MCKLILHDISISYDIVQNHFEIWQNMTKTVPFSLHAFHLYELLKKKIMRFKFKKVKCFRWKLMWAIKIIPQQKLLDCTLAVYELPSSETHEQSRIHLL